MKKVTATDRVKIHYTGKLTDGQVFDSSEGRDPLEFKMGQGQIIPGLESGLIDLEINQKKTIEVACSEAYGEVRPELKQQVPKDRLPQDINPEVGMGLVSKTPDGREMQLVITEVSENSVEVDANHPLAGKDLIFDVELVEIVDEG
jgi:FKBP-type peptidyl-prolyl cis-trans isomerase SlpA